MAFRRTPFLYRDQEPLGAVGKQVSTSPLARKAFSLEFSGGCTVLSIQASNSVLSEKALQAFKYAFLSNKKIGIGTLPSNVSPSQREVDKAIAAYEIARSLVDWSEKYSVEINELDKHEMSTEEGEHRSCDLKKECDGLPVDAKQDFVPHSSVGEVKDLDFTIHLPSKLEKPFFSDMKPLTPSVDTAFLDSLLAPTSCEGMDFFGSPFLDEVDWNGKFDRLETVGASASASLGNDAHEDIVSYMRDSDYCEDNLTSPIPSPGSPCSPCSPYGILN